MEDFEKAKKMEVIETPVFPIGYLDDRQLASLKVQKKVKYIHEVVTVNEDEESHVTYFIKPTMEMLQMVASFAKKDQEIEGLETMFNTCRVGGSDEVLQDDEMRISAYKALATIFKRREAIVKKR